MLISEALIKYFGYLEHRKAATQTTLITYRSILNQFYEVIGDKDVAELTLRDVDRFAELYSLRGYKAKTYRNKLCIVRSFIRYLWVKELSNIRPESVEIPPDSEADTIYLTVEEKNRLLAVITDPRDRAMMLVLLSSGLRVSEFCNLKTTDIFRRSVSVKHGKGRKHRVTFISRAAEDAIEAYKLVRRGYNDGYVFPNPSGGSLSRVVVGRKVKHYAERAGIKKHITVHTLRHTFATHYLDAGGRVEDLQQMLGHADLKTTMLYIHFTSPRLHAAYDTIMLDV